MPIDSKAGNEQSKVGKIQIGGNRGNLPQATSVALNSQWSTWGLGPTMNQEAGGREKTKGKATKLCRARH